MGYKDELFDFIQQFLRTILLKRISLSGMVLTYFRWRIIALLIPRSPSITFVITFPSISSQCVTASYPAKPIH